MSRAGAGGSGWVVMDAVILAGGLGTRLRELVPDVPKPMAIVAGRPFLAWLAEHWIARGVQRLILSVGYRHEVVRDFFGDAWGGRPVLYAVESQPLGTGGGLLLALSLATPRATTLVLNGDTFFDVSLETLRRAHGESRATVTMALTAGRGATRYSGVRLDDTGRVVELAARSTAAAPMVNGGVYLVEPGALPAGPASTPVSLEDELLPRLIASGARVQGVTCPGRFIDMGVPEDYRRCQDWFGNATGAQANPANH